MRNHFRRAIWSREERVPARFLRQVVLLLLCALAVLLVGCDASDTAGHARATATAAARATEAAQPLVVAVAVTQRGTLAADDVQLDLAVTITNHTSALVAITDMGCPYPTLIAELRNTANTPLWQNYSRLVDCPYVATLPHD